VTPANLINLAAAAHSLEARYTRFDGSTVMVRLGTTCVPGVRSHTRSYFYIDGRRVSRAAAAEALQADSRQRILEGQ